MRNINVNGLKIVFGNPTNKDKYTIYFLLKGRRKKKCIYPKNKENAKKIYQQIILRKPRWVEVRCAKANSIGSEMVATYCPKEFVYGSSKRVHSKVNKKWRK